MEMSAIVEINPFIANLKLTSKMKNRTDWTARMTKEKHNRKVLRLFKPFHCDICRIDYFPIT
jgi:hypothetical protein